MERQKNAYAIILSEKIRVLKPLLRYMSETTNITVLIAGRTYPLVVDKIEEQIVIQTATAINQRITQLQAQFQSKDKQDCLAMCLLELAVTKGNSHNNTTQIDEQELQNTVNRLIKSIDQMLD